MARASIEAPYAIASAPKPIDANNGRVHATPVDGLKASRKRKRHEVAVGVDGEGINIYNIQSHSLVTSYALPPQSYQCCPPCSVYSRSTATGAATRSTFAVVKDGQKGSKRRLLSYSARVENKRTTDNGFATPEKREHKLLDGNILSLDIVPSPSDDHYSVLASYRNGAAEFISRDLSKTHREDPADSTNEDDYEVEYSTVIDVESAKTGILKDREDVIALLEQSNTSTRYTPLLCRLVRVRELRRLELYIIRDPINNPIQTAKTALQLLTHYELSSRVKLSTNIAQYDLHTTSGQLYQLLDGQLTLYDLASTVPRSVTQLGNKTTPIDDFARVSASLVLALSKHQATLFETSFGSFQASFSMSTLSASRPKEKKRKRDDSDGLISFSAISAFTDLGVIVGMVGSEIMAVQVSDSLRKSKQSKSQRTLLSHVVGKGGLQETHDLDSHEESSMQWAEWTAKVDALVTKNDIGGLEELVANDPRLGQQRQPKQDHVEDHPSEAVNSDSIAINQLWPLPEAFDPNNIDRRKALYILSKVFHYGMSENDGLKVRVVSPKLFEWLALTGYLSISYLSKAFSAHTDKSKASHTILSTGEIMNAIRAIDVDFHLMRDLFSLPIHWEAGEVVQALKHLIQSFDTPSTDTATLALPAPPPANGGLDMVNGEHEHEADLELESKAAENELAFVMNALSTGLEVRSETLRVVILRLHAFPPNVVTATMRTMMSHSEIVFFIHILRIELADGGWTSKYVDAGEDETQGGLVNTMGGEDHENRPSDQAIRAIGDLLNCAVDAIGTSGWLVGQSSSMSRIDELIDSLRAEISAGLEGCYEMSSLGTLITELERFAASAGRSESMRATYDPPDGDQHRDERSLLPLGSSIEAPVLHDRKDKGQRKSKMAIGREKSRRVGKYSFDRIRI